MGARSMCFVHEVAAVIPPNNFFAERLRDHRFHKIHTHLPLLSSIATTNNGSSSSTTAAALSPAERVNAAALMLQAEAFEHFLARKFPSFKVPFWGGF